MSTTKTQRIFSLVLALFFIGSTVGIVFYYVSTNKQQANQEAAAAAAQKLLEQQSQQDQITPEGSDMSQTQLQGTTLSNFQPLNSISSLQALDLITGSGDTVKPGATVTVHYTGAVASTGVIFQSSHDTGKTATFGLNDVIPGWTQGIPGMKVGGTRRLLIPASLAYGANPPSGSGIPANADLVFDVELISIN